MACLTFIVFKNVQKYQQRNSKPGIPLNPEKSLKTTNYSIDELYFTLLGGGTH